MKKIFITVISALALFACNDDFITKEPLGVGSNLTFYDTPENCELAVNAIYDPLQWEEMYAVNYWGIADVASDDCEKGGGDEARRYNEDQLKIFELANYIATPLNSVVSDLWKGYYVGIGRANAMLDQTGEFVEGENAEVYKRLRGEARFLRAYYYFDMVRIWGPVPLITKSLTPDDAKSIGNRAEGDDANGTVQEKAIYDFIISELEAIKGDLPWSYDAANFGRITQGAAKALLAKAYLFSKDFDNAYIAATDLINDVNNPYSLEPHYQDLFDMDMMNEQSSEIVFSIQYIDGTSSTAYNREQGNEGSIKPTYVGPRYVKFSDGSGLHRTGDYGYGFMLPRQDLVDQFDATDPRLDMMYGPNDSIYADFETTGSPSWHKIDYPSWTTGYYCKKGGVNYNSFYAQKAQATGKDIIVLRYADVLLIAAEAAAETGKAGDAKTYVNKLRERARNSGRTMTAFNTYTYAASTEPADLSTVGIDEVRAERRRELYCEGHRYFDVVRWGLADDIFGAITQDIAGFPVSWNPATLGRLPIPNTQIILHSAGNLKQNPGY